MKIEIYRYNPDADEHPWMQSVNYDSEGRDLMVLDVLEDLKKRDTTLSYRRSCREGVCGSDALNLNGKNRLGCVTPLSEVIIRDTLVIRPLPGLPVIRDLVVDMDMFWRQYERIKPYLQNDNPVPAIERLQSPVDRKKLDGLYECIMCGCCSTSCPSWWWNPEKYLGPAALLHMYRFVQDSRDTATSKRLSQLQDPFSLYRCHSIQNCDFSCPKGLSPHTAISNLKRLMLKAGL